MKIRFCGAATGVTGSCHLISTDSHKVLLDCGQFQGGAAMERLNYEDFPFNPAEIECVVLSHAHIDHCGRLPLLVKRGFKGKIYCTDATGDLLDVMLKDSAHIHEQDAEWQNRKNERAGRSPVEPLYTTNDALDTIKLISPVHYDQLIELNDQMKVVFNDAGHILGSAIIELWVEEKAGSPKKIVFSGDLGMPDRPILRDLKYIKKADCVIMETTYGNRLHEANAESIHRLLDIAVETIRRGGNVVIPSFAVGRTQELLFELNKVYDGNMPGYTDVLKDVPVYVDSPMAAAATEVFMKNAQVYDEEMRGYILRGDHPLVFPGLHFVETSDESKAINMDLTPKIIISASGMCDAGRIRHHLKHNLYNARNSVVFVGYQAEGTLGKTLLEGAEEVKLFGETIAVKAQIHNLEGFSGHADRNVLFSWLAAFQKVPSQIFLVHGEEQSKLDFAAFVKSKLGYDCIPVMGFDEYEISADGTGAELTAEEDFAGESELGELRDKLSSMHSSIESVLYNAATGIDPKLSPERLAEIKNAVAALEKDIMSLGAAVTVDADAAETK